VIDPRHYAARAPSYWLTRFVFLRLLGLVYTVAFLIVVLQWHPLLGSDGLLPAAPFLDAVRAEEGRGSGVFLRLPTIFWLDGSDEAFRAGGWIGLGLSLLVLGGLANAPILFVLWLLYMSFVHVGQIFYGYGWEILLLETGFLAIFLAPLGNPRPFAKRSPPSPVVIVLLRWLVFRLMFGAGLIKLRGDPCWRDLTCLVFHYETQPNPNPLSWYFHQAPVWFHKLEVLFNHLVELVVPFFVFGPRRPRLAAGALVVVFQVLLILSGNLSFLNWLTIAVAGAPRAPRGGSRADEGGSRRRRGARRGRGPAEPQPRHEHAFGRTGDEHVVRSLRAGQHLRRLRQRGPGALRDRVRGHGRPRRHAGHRLAGIRVQGQAR